MYFWKSEEVTRSQSGKYGGWGIIHEQAPKCEVLTNENRQVHKKPTKGCYRESKQ